MMRETEDTSDFSDPEDSIDESLDQLARRPRSVPTLLARSRAYHVPPRLLLPGQDTLPDEQRRVVLDIPTELTPRPPEAALIAQLASNKPRARFLAMAIGIAFALPLIVIGRLSVIANRSAVAPKVVTVSAAAVNAVSAEGATELTSPASSAAATSMPVPQAPAMPAASPIPSEPTAEMPAPKVVLQESAPAQPASPPARGSRGSRHRAKGGIAAAGASSAFVPPNAAQFREDFTR